MKQEKRPNQPSWFGFFYANPGRRSCNRRGSERGLTGLFSIPQLDAPWDHEPDFSAAEKHGTESRTSA